MRSHQKTEIRTKGRSPGETKKKLSFSKSYCAQWYIPHASAIRALLTHWLRSIFSSKKWLKNPHGLNVFWMTPWGYNGHDSGTEKKWRYLPYLKPMFQGYVREYSHKTWAYIVQYLHSRILKFPLNVSKFRTCSH